MTNAQSNENTGKPIVDFSEIGKPVLIDTSTDTMNLGADQQEIVHAALEAIKNMDISNATLTAESYEGGIIEIKKTVEVLTLSDSENSTVELDGFVLANAGMHISGVSFVVFPNEDGDYEVRLNAMHDGSYDETIDATKTTIHYIVDAEGEFTLRVGVVDTQELNGNVDEQEHGSWTIQAAQTLEHNLQLS